MDWAKVIERNSQALRAIIQTLFVMLAQATGNRIPPALYRAMLRLLYPAEATLRRLIVMAARGVVVEPAASRPMPEGSMTKARAGRSSRAFPLFDPRKSFAPKRPKTTPKLIPRIYIFSPDPRISALWAPPPQPILEPQAVFDDGLVSAIRLSHRLDSLKRALDDLPRQAKRLVRLRRRHLNATPPTYISPMRPGHPPGYRRKPTHAIDELLIECHALAFDAMLPDTS
jgi:hypothetical protein